MEVPAVSWSPVVYARTAAADTWWQALPAGSSGTGWLARTVSAVFAGGTGLDTGPRFLLAQDNARRIVGVACRARRLSELMCSDDQRRELSCFVGWMASRAEIPGTRVTAGPRTAAGPAFADLAAGYAQWAGPVYEEVMRAVWELPYSPYHQPALSSPAAAPWEETISFDLAGPVPGPGPGDGPWPPSAWPGIWTVALAATGLFTCVLGWEHAPLGQPAGVTFLGTADAPPREAPALPDRTVLSPVPGLSPEADPRHEPEPALPPAPAATTAAATTAAAAAPESEPPPGRWSRRRKITVLSVLAAAVVTVVAIVVLLAVGSSPAKPPAIRATVSPSSSGVR
jgi:hypothetical protein